MEKDTKNRIEELEKRVAALEGQVQEQPIRIMKEELNLLKMRKERSNIILGQEDLIP